MRTCLIRGSGDIGSAVAHALFSRGFGVAIHDCGARAYPRRGRAFLDAFFDGEAALEGVAARRVHDIGALEWAASAGRCVAVTCQPLREVLDRWMPQILVDARMRKREVAECQRGKVALTLGLGPGFVAGESTDLVVETAWGERLGAVITSGPSAAFTGVPRIVGGYGRERYGYAPACGRLVAEAHLGRRVARGDAVARVGEFSVAAPIDGVVVGLTRSGVEVGMGVKILEIDPRGRPELAFGIGERARRIAEGVLAAIALHDVASRRPGCAARFQPTCISGA